MIKHRIIAVNRDAQLAGMYADIAQEGLRKSVQRRLDEIDEEVKSLPYLDHRYIQCLLGEVLDLIDVAKDNNVPDSGWISVKDRLPEIPHENPQRGILVVNANGNVLLTRALLKTEIQGEILIFDDTHSDCFFDLVSGKEPRINTMIKGNHIVYWMPIPELPKETENAVDETTNT